MRAITVRRVLFTALAASLIVGIGAVAYQARAASLTNCGKNERGLTYGVASDAPTPDYEPDLIAAAATNGKSGYVYKTDLETAEQPASNPSEAVRMMKQLEATAATVFLSSASDQLGITLSGDIEAAIVALNKAQPGKGLALLVNLGAERSKQSEAGANAVVAEALKKAQSSAIRRIKVYEKDGSTVVGTFEIGGGSVFAVTPEDYDAN